MSSVMGVERGSLLDGQAIRAFWISDDNEMVELRMEGVANETIED